MRNVNENLNHAGSCDIPSPMERSGQIQANIDKKLLFHNFSRFNKKSSENTPRRPAGGFIRHASPHAGRHTIPVRRPSQAGTVCCYPAAACSAIVLARLFTEAGFFAPAG
jgi:hypothetical protein